MSAFVIFIKIDLIAFRQEGIVFDSCAVISAFGVFFVAQFNGQGKCRSNRANGMQNLLSLVGIGLKGFCKFMTAVAPVAPALLIFVGKVH